MLAFLYAQEKLTYLRALQVSPAHLEQISAMRLECASSHALRMAYIANHLLAWKYVKGGVSMDLC